MLQQTLIIMLHLHLSGADYLNICYQRVTPVGEIIYGPISVAMASSVSLGSPIIFLLTGYIYRLLP